MAARSFPLSFVPNYKTVGRGYRAIRKTRKGIHLHAGVDLMADVGTPVFAVADGVVLRGPYIFAGEYNPPSYAVIVAHGPLTVLYGEIQCEGAKRQGDRVRQFEQIARVGRTGTGSMLHIEVYQGRYVKGKEVDPTPHLDAWRANLPRVAATPGFEHDRPDHTSTRAR